MNVWKGTTISLRECNEMLENISEAWKRLLLLTQHNGLLVWSMVRWWSNDLKYWNHSVIIKKKNNQIMSSGGLEHYRSTRLSLTTSRSLGYYIYTDTQCNLKTSNISTKYQQSAETVWKKKEKVCIGFCPLNPGARRGEGRRGWRAEKGEMTWIGLKCASESRPRKWKEFGGIKGDDKLKKWKSGLNGRMGRRWQFKWKIGGWERVRSPEVPIRSLLWLRRPSGHSR